MASPYSHSDQSVREQRYIDACKAAANLMARGYIIYSPIVHSHPIAKWGLPKGWDFWRKHCEAMLVVCGQLAILRLDGWHKSIGIAAEAGFATRANIPIVFIDPMEVGIEK